MKTRNKYFYPIERTRKVRVDYKSSPAHVGRLKNSVDFIVPVGTTIKAGLDGVVVDVKQDSDIGGDDESFDKFGNYIEIRHRNGEYSIYEHIMKNGSKVKKGERVKANQPIGLSGATGWLGGLGPHTHFDVHKYYGKRK